MIALDITVKAPVIVLPFDPAVEGACWCIDTGMLQIKTDEAILNPLAKPTFEKYNLALRRLSLSWYRSKKELIESKKDQSIIPVEKLINDFEVELAISLLRNNKEPKKGNLLLQGKLPILGMSLSSFSYQQLLRLGECFADKLSPPQVAE